MTTGGGEAGRRWRKETRKNGRGTKGGRGDGGEGGCDEKMAEDVPEESGGSRWSQRYNTED